MPAQHVPWVQGIALTVGAELHICCGATDP